MVFEALQSELSLDKSDFTRGLRDAAKETITFGKVAKSNLDDVGDEAEEAGDKAGRAAMGFAALRVSTTGLSFSLGGLFSIGTLTTIMLTGLAVAAGAVLLALLPIVAGAMGVAIAFGAIIGSGIFAGMKELKKAFADARKEIEPMVRELGERFVPFLKETIGMLPGLVSSIIDALGPLDKFFAALKTLRNAAFDLLPKLIAWFIKLGKWALPILKDLGNWIVSDLAPAFRSLIKRGKSTWQMLVRLAPKVQKLIDKAKGVWKWLKGLWKQFQKSSKKGTTLRKKVNQLATAAQRFWKKGLKPTLKALKPLVNELIKAAPFVLKLATDIGKLALNLGTKLLPYLIPIADLLTKIVKWFNNLAPPVKKAILLVGGLFLAAGPLISAFWAIVGAIGVVVGSISLVGIAIAALIVGIVLLADYIYKNWDKIVRWTKDLASDIAWWFNHIATKITDAIKGAINGAVNWLRHDAKSDLLGALASVGRAVAGAFKSAFNAAMPNSVPIPKVTLGKGVPGPDFTIGGGSLNLPQLAEGGIVRSPTLALIGEAGPEKVQPLRGRDERRSSGSQPVYAKIVLDSDRTEDLIKDGATEVVQTEVESARRKMERRGTF